MTTGAENVPTQSNTQLTAGSLFAGIGGFDLGFQAAGIKTLWQVEIDPSCQGILRRHFPDAEIHNDIRQCGKHNLRPVDILTGGFPCQDLSVAGQRKGLVSGERSGLWFEFHRIITELAPRWVVIENVPGLLNSHDGRDFAIVLGGLTGILPEVPPDGWGNAGFARGPFYQVAYRVLDAQFFGVAQRRRRVFLVGYLDPLGRSVGDEALPKRSRVPGLAAEILFESTGGFGDTAPSREAGKGITDLAGHRTSSTLRGFGHGWQGQHNDTNAVAVGIDVRNSKEQPDNVSGTLQSKKTGGYSLNYQNPVAYTVNFADSKGSRPDRPNGGLYVKEVDQTDALTGNGSITHLAYGIYDEQTPKVGDEVMPTLRNRETGGGFQQYVAIPINTQITTRHHALGERTGFGVGDDNDPAFTLQANHSHAIAFGGNNTSGSIDVATACNAHGGTGRIDFESETFVVNGNSTPETADNLALPLRSDDGSGNRQVLAFNAYQRTVGNVHSPLTSEEKSRNEAGVISYQGVCSTLNASGSGLDRPGGQGAEPGYYVPSGMGVRRLTPVECERLQGLPDDHTEGQSDSTRYRQLGNAVCATVSYWIGKRIVMVEGRYQ